MAYLDNVNFEICTTEIPVGDEVQFNAAYETLADLNVTGTNLTWYSDAELTEEIPDTTPLVDGTIYYVTSTVDDCEGSALSIFFDEAAASVDTFLLSQIRVYPNPTSDVINITGIEHIDGLKLYDLTGKLIMSTSKLQFSVQHLQSGVYLLELKLGETTKTEKIVIK